MDMKKAEKDHIETLIWFEEFYSRNKKMVDIIVADNKKKMIEYEMPDIISCIIKGEYKINKIYMIKGFTKFNWDELMMNGVTLELCSLKGIPHANYCYSTFHPGINYIGETQYLSEESLKKLRKTFKSLIINLEYYKKYNNLEVE